MSKVTLTEDHRLKVVEMTKFIMYEYDVSIDNTTSPFIHYQHKTDTDKKGKIYWLEHLVYHIAKKILNRDDSALLMFRTCCLSNIMPIDSPHHPVLYLYERYRRNKEAKEKQLQLPLN
jgi:hypothetical protein